MNRPAGQPEFELDRLKELLLRPETDRLDAVEARAQALDLRLGAAERLEAATAEVLVGAFRRAEIAQHRELAGAVAPVVVAAIRNEIKNSKDMMVEALYPITGRLVAAAVANAFRDLVAGLNDRLDRTLSTHHWKLRLQSIATGRPISELALAEAQRPILRRLLLLERGSGRLVAAWHSDSEEDSQSELVSGLIAAITEFAASVYGARSGELRTLDMGDARVFLRGAPMYLVAAECAGALRPDHEREIDDAFLSLVSRLSHAPDGAEPALAQMAQTLFRQAEPAQRKSSLPLALVGCALVGLIAWLASGPVLRTLHERRIEAAFQQALSAQPDLETFPLHLVVDHAARRATVVGLAPSDAAAQSLAESIAAAAAPYKAAQHTASVGAVALTDALQKRVEDLAAQVATLTIESRAASERALAATRELKADVKADLQAETRAARERLGAAIAAAAPTQRQKLADLFSRTAIFFAQRDTLAEPAQAARRADEIAAALKDVDMTVHVVGHADSSGGDKRNLEIAQARANAVVGLLAERGVDRARLLAVARSTALPIGAAGDPRGRRVTFELAFDDEKAP